MQVALCDGDQDAAAKIKNTLTDLCKKNRIPVAITSYPSAESLLFDMEDLVHDTDALLLEADQPEGRNGVDTALQAREAGYQGEIVFITHNKEKVFDAFDATPFHYILKGEMGEPHMEEILKRAAARIGHHKQEMISLACAGERRHIPIEEIRYFEVDKRIIRVHYGDPDQTFEFYSTIGKLENALLGKGILRVHRAFLLAVSHVERATSKDAFLDTGASVPLGRTYLKEFREALEAVEGQGL